MTDVGLGHGVVVGVADMAIARGPAGALVTYALGSCIGLSAYDPVTKVGGLLHYMLPQPAEHTDPRTVQPCMFATTGIPMLMQRLREAGAQQSRLLLCAAGGAGILEGAGRMAIGKRNHAMLRKVLWQMGIALVAEDSGGSIARTMTLELSTGEVRIKTRECEKLIGAAGRPKALAKGGEP